MELTEILEWTINPATGSPVGQAILDKFHLPFNIGKEDLRSCLPWTLANLRDHRHLEYSAQHDRVTPAALAKLFDNYIRRLVRLIDEVLNKDDTDASASTPGSSIDNPLIITETNLSSGRHPVA
ncbi:hypothetical protein ASPFODRAFT_216268 [Aspergillus luchuensis CBS 106.47]|uniref:Uncharacterized protein n=1 Tax=Aspergillus luchuensis (strain CBS 106.47) TaxID=1137211 RepID=A0A1M3TSQ3_ASPLC|nr:hypothetical protein ASPFODRAFT_216268 [Aspergillus luchuensis CBS 106.47]